MSLFCLKTQDLTWQDRTINIEVMMAPARSQLLYNKHKGLKTKYQQENENLEREKSSYLRSYKTEQRLMERRKELYSKRRNDIIIRRTSGDSRRRWSTASLELGRSSAPPKLEETRPTSGESVFLTQLKQRESKSAGARIKPDCSFVPQRQPPATTNQLALPSTPDVPLGAVSPGISSRAPTPGKPYLERQRSVRFHNVPVENNPDEETTTNEPELTIDERIQRFMANQEEFNNRKTTTPSNRGDVFTPPGNSVLLARRYSTLRVNLGKLENAFDDFCSDGTSSGLQKLVQFATKMKAHVRTARNSSVVPSVATLKGSKAFKGMTSKTKPAVH